MRDTPNLLSLTFHSGKISALKVQTLGLSAQVFSSDIILWLEYILSQKSRILFVVPQGDRSFTPPVLWQRQGGGWRCSLCKHKENDPRITAWLNDMANKVFKMRRNQLFIKSPSKMDNRDNRDKVWVYDYEDKEVSDSFCLQKLRYCSLQPSSSFRKSLRQVSIEKLVGGKGSHMEASLKYALPFLDAETLAGLE